MALKKTFESLLVPALWLLWIPASIFLPWFALAFPEIVLESLFGIRIDALMVSIEKAGAILMWLIPTTFVSLGAFNLWFQGWFNQRIEKREA